MLRMLGRRSLQRLLYEMFQMFGRHWMLGRQWFLVKFFVNLVADGIYRGTCLLDRLGIFFNGIRVVFKVLASFVHPVVLTIHKNGPIINKGPNAATKIGGVKFVS